MRMWRAGVAAPARRYAGVSHSCRADVRKRRMGVAFPSRFNRICCRSINPLNRPRFNAAIRPCSLRH